MKQWKKTVISLVAAALIVLSAAARDAAHAAGESYTYEGKTRDILFEVPAGWTEKPVTLGGLEVKFKYAGETFTQIHYRVIDLLPLLDLPETLRPLISSELFTEETIAQLVSDTLNEPTVETLAIRDNLLFLARNKEFRTIAPYEMAVVIENGYYHVFFLYLTGEESLRQREAEFIGMVSSFRLNAAEEPDEPEPAEGADQKAGGGLTLTHSFVYYNREEKMGGYFARIENNSPDPLWLERGRLTVYSTDGEMLFEENYVQTDPYNVLIEPGQYAYVQEDLLDPLPEGAEIGEAVLELSASSEGWRAAIVPSTVAIITEEDGSLFVGLTLTNDTDEPMENLRMSFALYDETDRLIYVGSWYLDDVILHPHSTITYKGTVYFWVHDYLRQQGLTPARADGIVYQREE